ncbi:MAG TPA: hypothetical protein VM890_02385 [Longimicrobium sp.]|nr:hypothetical protein [Longimicrobium sp.]
MVRDEIRASEGLGVGVYSALTLLLLAAVTGVLLTLCVAEIRRGHSPALERHWGGFGGAGGGWRMSPSLTYLIIALLFGVLLTVLGGRLLDNRGRDASSSGGTSTRAAADSSATARR